LTVRYIEADGVEILTVGAWQSAKREAIGSDLLIKRKIQVRTARFLRAARLQGTPVTRETKCAKAPLCA